MPCLWSVRGWYSLAALPTDRISPASVGVRLVNVLLDDIREDELFTSQNFPQLRSGRGGRDNEPDFRTS